MKKTVALALFLLGFGATAGTLISFAQQSTPQAFGQRGFGMHQGVAQEEKANLLGMTADELKAALDSGKTIKDIALEKGVTLDQFPGRKGLGFDKCPNLDEKAQILGMTADELKTALESGKTLLQIAESKGFTAEQWKAKMLEQASARLQQLVTDGKITQEQADQRLQEMKDRQAACDGTKKPFQGGKGDWGKGRGMGQKKSLTPTPTQS